MTQIIWVDCGVSQSGTSDRLIERLEQSEVEVIHNPRSTPQDQIPIIRWGSARFIELDNLYLDTPILNHGDEIEFNLHKDWAHKKMLEAGVRAPAMWTDYMTAKRASREMGTDFLRRRKHHVQGKDIIRLNPRRDKLSRERRSGYYVQYLEKEAEFRLHIFQDKCIGVAEKVRREDEEASNTIWNFENGWDLVYTPKDQREEDIPNYREMEGESIKALRALNLDFGAVDIIMAENKPYILEVNTAPKLYQTKRYSKNFINWIQEQED